MADINKVFSEAQKLKWNIESLLKLSTFETYGGLSGLHIDYEDGERLFLMEKLREIMEQLSDVSPRLKYLSRPIKEVEHDASDYPWFPVDNCIYSLICNPSLRTISDGHCSLKSFYISFFLLTAALGTM